ncbi:MAG TPA: hypothetical protein VMF89_05455 [Polyangiales bacterium]|nr:hypothetical protein [Polyangiales bacterium]
MRTTPEWLVERLAAGELPEAATRELRKSPGVEAQLERIARSDAELLEQHPAADVVREVERRRAASEQRSAGSPVWLGAAAAVCGALLFLFVRDDAAPSGRTRTTEQIVERGFEPHLVIFRKTQNGAERLSSSRPVRAGDMLQLAYVPAGRKYGVIASIDSRGTITLHLPERADTAARLSERNQSTLPHAFELDDTPGVERFVFISADEPFATQVVIDALRTSARLEDRFTRFEIPLEKQP